MRYTGELLYVTPVTSGNQFLNAGPCGKTRTSTQTLPTEKGLNNTTRFVFHGTRYIIGSCDNVIDFIRPRCADARAVYVRVGSVFFLSLFTGPF